VTDLDLMLKFMLQVLVVLGACKVVGWLGVKFLGQAQVTMEMITGVLLGPSLLGLFSPQLQHFLFPMLLDPGNPASGRHPSMTILYVIAQIGLVLYMFLVGLEFNTQLISTRIKGAVLTSLAGIVCPFILGLIVFFTMLQGRTDLFQAGISPWNQALFLGAAMCITAFPMLARIIYEAGIAGTPLGTLSLGAGATDDAAAWCILAIVLATSQGNAAIAIWAIGGGALFAVLMFTVGRKLLANMGKGVDRERGLSQEKLVTIILLLFAGAYYTDAIGIYAVFGAFIIGASMPKGEFGHQIRLRLEQVTVGLFLPFFFVFSGLNTKIGSINSAALWVITGLLVAASILGKFGGCYWAARIAGEKHREALAIGTLMNARGLMELIILNIGLQQGVITTELYTIMVMMAIITTVMAAPIFEKIYGREAKRLASEAGAIPLVA
jgi:Kef-type K+ transport system membrane component KefB